MKRIGLSFLIGIFLFTACGQTTAVPVIASVTSTQSISPTPTETVLPSVTTTATTSITPLATVPIFTPTFDGSTIVTVTPALKAECPKEERMCVRFDSF
jgi:hypothetical protein